MIRIAKFVSAALGALIVVALALLGYGLFIHDKTPDKNPQPQNAPEPQMVPSAPAAAPSLSSISLGQPPGSSIAATVPAGAWLHVTVTGGGEPDRVLVVDLARGRVVATISLGADAASPAAAR